MRFLIGAYKASKSLDHPVIDYEFTGFWVLAVLSRFDFVRLKTRNESGSQLTSGTASLRIGPDTPTRKSAILIVDDESNSVGLIAQMRVDWVTD